MYKYINYVLEIYIYKLRCITMFLSIRHMSWVFNFGMLALGFR